VDTTARIVAEGLSRRLGQQVIVESKPGASTTIAAAQLARATPDGHTLGVFSSTYGTAAAMYSKLPFRPVDDFSMISQIIEFPLVLATYSEHSARSVADLVNAARATSTPLLYGTPGLGSVQHLLVEHLAQQAKIQFQHVPYRGGAQALTELLGRRIDFMVDSPAWQEKMSARSTRPAGTSRPMALAVRRLDDQLVAIWYFHRNVGRLGAAQDIHRNSRPLTVHVGEAWAVVSGHWRIAGRRTAAMRSITIWLLRLPGTENRASPSNSMPRHPL